MIDRKVSLEKMMPDIKMGCGMPRQTWNIMRKWMRGNDDNQPLD